MENHTPTSAASSVVNANPSWASDKGKEIKVEVSEVLSPNWGPDAPKGGKIVMDRILKEKATVPLFLAQTLIQSLRDVGYNHTTSALCEHVDNAIEGGATEIRVFFRQADVEKKPNDGGKKRTDVAVYDNGRGMAPAILKVAMSFGGSMSYGNRNGIARFGMGMKTAALSMSPVLEVYSWQEPDAIYSMTLDVEAIGREKGNLIGMPDPTFMAVLPDEIVDLFLKPLSYPTNRAEQVLAVSNGATLADALGKSGTVVFMPDCDRLHYAKAKTLVDHAIKEMSRVYRRQIGKGLNLYINNRLVEAFDPTYSMPNARHVRVLDALEVSAKHSNLVVSKSVKIPLSEGAAETAEIMVKIYKLPIEEWGVLSRKSQKNDLHVFDGLTVSILRNDREVYAGTMTNLTTRHSVTNWYRIQIDFSGLLDEAFGIAANKQGVRLKQFVIEALREAIGEDISSINDGIKRFQSQEAAARFAAKPSTSEARANESDPFQRNTMPSLTPEEEAQLDANLRGLAVTLRRDGETDDEAFDRVKRSRYIIDLKHDDYWPFYDVKSKFGRIIMTLNTAHPFFAKLYEPLSKLSAPSVEADDSAGPQESNEGPIVALELLLLSLARTQSRMSTSNEDAAKLLDSMRREWSETYRVQLPA